MRRWLSLAVGIVLLGLGGRADAAPPPHPPVGTRFVSLTGATWAQLAAGRAGQAVIAYYLASKGPSHPAIVVWLRDDGRASLARVYEAPVGRHSVPIHWSRPLAPQLSRLKPILVMAAPQGWWSRGGLPNENVTVKVFGPVYTMWGGKVGPQSYLPTVPRGPLAFVVYLHGIAPGVPTWDDRRLIPPLAGKSYIRASYAQSECAGQRTWVPGPSPLWPYVAYSGHFLQGIGTETPPLVVNWTTGQVEKFSEVVSLRNQSCSYGFYSNAAVVPGHLNHPDFESPWGFYTLSPAATGLPNLIIRVDWRPTQSLGALGLHRLTPLALPLMARSSESVRYSWADHPGNQEFNYKVGLLGFRAVRAHTRIMGGRETIVAPPYAGYPASLIQQRWPVVTFVSQNARPYQTSEGLYAWSGSQVGHAFMFGERATPSPAAFATIPDGTAGEYRIGVGARPWLYASPIDRQLHLLGAQAGLFQVNSTTRLLERNLGPGPYLNDWRLEVRAGSTYRMVARLDAMDRQVLLYAGPSGLRIALAPFQPAAFTILPPTTPASWRQFVQQAAPYQAGNSPVHLRSWMPASTAVLTAASGHIADVVPTASGFQAVVTVGAGGAAAQLPGLPREVAPGAYALRYQAAHEVFQMVPLVRGKPALRIATVVGRTHPGQPVAVGITVANRGVAPWRGAVTVWDAKARHALEAAIPAGGVWRGAVALPANGRRLTVRVAAGGQVVRQTAAVAGFSRPALAVLAQLSFAGARPTLGFLGGLAALAALSAQIWRRHTRGRTPSRRRRKLTHAR